MRDASGIDGPCGRPVRPGSEQRGMTVIGTTVLAAALTAAVIAALAWSGDDPLRRQAVIFAAATTGSGALAGWLVGRLGRGQQAATAVATGLGATLVRTAPALAALAWLAGPGRRLGEAGAAGLLVAFYLSLLAVDVAMNIMEGRREAGRHREPG